MAATPTSDRRSIAVVSDIHGNLTALRAVLADIESRGITEIVDLGDIVGKGPRGSACVALARERCAVTVAGNWEAMLLAEGLSHEALLWWRDELTDADREWLAALPLVHDMELSGRTIRFLHASALSVFTRVFAQHSDEEFAAMFANTELTGPGPVPQVVCYGDIHNAYVRTMPGRMLLNAGSVGNPLDEPTASYLVLHGSDGPGPFGVEFVRVPYDVEAEIAVAFELGMPDLDAYAAELRTARYSR
ncbi:protein phosphatase [Diaminobutyricimonas aerilata]|uniref:Protein phosphatase n=1 Tax=Diaminobutyricimonas aerilata TaxID=1162967 RepID=A0A2M9CF89_9MICO|nr:metallophosphoesterase family protein [Diaminobutyricimonas aerilata]PJJ70520.1 protein phosphatase [Diaminobutyricimonas aerilata]